jgi:hypothetical protein
MRWSASYDSRRDTSRIGVGRPKSIDETPGQVIVSGADHCTAREPGDRRQRRCALEVPHTSIDTRLFPVECGRDKLLEVWPNVFGVQKM